MDPTSFIGVCSESFLNLSMAETKIVGNSEESLKHCCQSSASAEEEGTIQVHLVNCVVNLVILEGEFLCKNKLRKLCKGY